MFDDYLALVSVFFVLRGLVHPAYRQVYKRTRLRDKAVSLMLNRIFAQNTPFYVRGFWLSLLWLGLYLYEKGIISWQVM